MNKCKLFKKHEYKNKIGETMIPCRLFDNETCFQCCHGIEQTTKEVFDLVLHSVVTPQELVDYPNSIIGHISEKNKKYAEKILQVCKDWSIVKRTCARCLATPVDSPIIGSVEQVDLPYPGLNPVRED